jgi:hypothetical protein
MFLSARSIQNAKMQKMHVETLVYYVLHHSSFVHNEIVISHTLHEPLKYAKYIDKQTDTELTVSQFSCITTLYNNKMKTNASCKKCYNIFQFSQFKNCCCDLIYHHFIKNSAL